MTTATATQTPTCEKYEAAVGRMNELRGELDRLDLKLNELQSSVRHGTKNRLDLEAEALIRGEEAPSDADDRIAGDIAKLRERKGVVRRALEIQERIVEQLRDARGRELAESRREEHAAIVRDMSAIWSSSRRQRTASDRCGTS